MRPNVAIGDNLSSLRLPGLPSEPLCSQHDFYNSAIPASIFDEKVTAAWTHTTFNPSIDLCFQKHALTPTRDLPCNRMSAFHRRHCRFVSNVNGYSHRDGIIL